MKLTYVGALAIYGVLWLAIAIFLGLKGLSYSLEEVGVLKLETISEMEKKLASHRIAMMIAWGALLGFLKGKFVFSKVVHRVVCQMTEKEEPLSLFDLFTKRMLVLIGGMMVLGQIMRFSPIPLTVKAVFDFAIASALIYGSLLYFKKAYLFHKELPE